MCIVCSTNLVIIKSLTVILIKKMTWLKSYNLYKFIYIYYLKFFTKVLDAQGKKYKILEYDTT